jgi:hypothetical protein
VVSRSWHLSIRIATCAALLLRPAIALERLNERDYKLFVDNQLERSKAVLENEVHHSITMLAWPFGIHNAFLEHRAASVGYQAAFSLECRAATGSDPLMSLPRCLVSDEDVGPRFLSFIKRAAAFAK